YFAIRGSLKEGRKLPSRFLINSCGNRQSVHGTQSPVSKFIDVELYAAIVAQLPYRQQQAADPNCQKESLVDRCPISSANNRDNHRRTARLLGSCLCASQPSDSTGRGS